MNSVSVIVRSFIYLIAIICQTNTDKTQNKREQKRENGEATFALTKTSVINVMPTKETETTQNPEKENKLAVVARVIAWYINPAVYVLFSVLYFIIGPYL